MVQPRTVDYQSGPVQFDSPTDGLAFGRTMDRLYGLILDRSRPPGPTVGPLGALHVVATRYLSAWL